MEGMSYGMAALHALGIRPRGTERMIQSFWWPRYAEVTPNMVLDTGDFNGRLRALSGFAWEAEHAHDASSRAFYGTAPTRTLLGLLNVNHTGRVLEMVPGILDLTCCAGPLAPAPPPPPSRIFPGRGSAVLRSGWAPTDTVISIRVGPWFNHGHHDQGSFQVAAFGEKLISEAGYANYYTDPHYHNYFMQAAGYNTVLVDGNPFGQSTVGGRYWKALAHYPSFTAHVLSPGVDYLSAQLSAAYGGVLKNFQREFIFLKPDVLIVYDRIAATAPHRYTWLLHIPIGATTRSGQTNAFIKVEQASAALTAMGANFRWTIQATSLASDRYGDLDRIDLHQPYEFRLESTPGTRSTSLVGMRFGGNGSTVAPLKPISAANSEILESPNDSNPWTVNFRTGAGPLVVDNISTDGRILGCRRERFNSVILAVGVHSVSRAGTLIFRASEPVVVSLDKSAKLFALDLFCTRVTELRVRANRPPVKVVLDGKPIYPPVLDGSVDLKNVAAGEHVVRIFD